MSVAPGVWGLLHPQVSCAHKDLGTREVLARLSATWPLHTPHLVLIPTMAL